MSPDFQANLKEMRVRSTEHPPSQQDIDRILAKGASDADVRKFKRFLRRMAFFLDRKTVPCLPVSALSTSTSRTGSCFSWERASV
jgi:hypothetical protein